MELNQLRQQLLLQRLPILDSPSVQNQLRQQLLQQLPRLAFRLEPSQLLLQPTLQQQLLNLDFRLALNLQLHLLHPQPQQLRQHLVHLQQRPLRLRHCSWQILRAQSLQQSRPLLSKLHRLRRFLLLPC